MASIAGEAIKGIGPENKYRGVQSQGVFHIHVNPRSQGLGPDADI
jgi:hypothetical protein